MKGNEVGQLAPIPESPRRLLNPIWPDTAYKLGIGRTTVYELIAAGELKAVHIGRRTLVAETEIERYVARLISE